MGNEFVILSVSITPPSGGTQIHILKATYHKDLNRIRFTTEDTTGEKEIWVSSVYTGTIENRPMTITMAADLTSGATYKTSISLLIDTHFYTPDHLSTVAYDSTWVFDSNTLVTACADPYGASTLHCTTQNLKVVYSYQTESYKIPFSNQVEMLGDYKLDEGIGNTLSNSQGSLGALGASLLQTLQSGHRIQHLNLMERAINILKSPILFLEVKIYLLPHQLALHSISKSIKSQPQLRISSPTSPLIFSLFTSLQT